MSLTPCAVETLTGDAVLAEIEALCEVLTACVAGGASVGFLSPLSLARARAFWERVAGDVASRARCVLVVRDAAGQIAGTVQLVLEHPENQPHRADVAKLLVHPRVRRHGVGEALMKAAEAAAREEGKTLLVLDTATAEADRLYRRLGWQLCGRIPDYALLPGGQPCATTIFYKVMAAAHAASAG